ncbi:MAG: hypothetical protein JNM70_02885 [Anaerolineae bacterium]|nr:hypothetical protein [Anaerolineae bacterium]
MLPILVLLALFLLGVVLIIRFVTRFAENLTGNLVTEHFRAAEFILEHHQAPESWGRAAAKPQLLKRLDKLIAFFETCPFFEDEESRTSLLAQLHAEHVAWEAKPVEAIIPQPQNRCI